MNLDMDIREGGTYLQARAEISVLGRHRCRFRAAAEITGNVEEDAARSRAGGDERVVSKPSPADEQMPPIRAKARVVAFAEYDRVPSVLDRP